ncbi:MAG: hypothetical protein RR259_00825 [Odoribacter sp.]
MKKVMFIVVGACVLSLSSCVENSQKYKALQARLDSLSMVSTAQNTEMEDVFSDLNEISAGMQSIREAEHLLTLEAEKETKSGEKKQQLNQLKSDVKAISEAIAAYKEQIAKLEGKNRKQSAEFKKLIAGLNAELDARNQKIIEITNQLADKNQQLAVKTQEVNNLTQNVADLDKETKSQKTTISEQDQAIHEAHYLVGNRKELKEANVISRQGLFCPPIVSSQAQKANFKTMDVREVKSIPLNTKKAKVLSVHSADSYILETGEDGNLILKINDEKAFWKQTKYLVVMIG